MPTKPKPLTLAPPRKADERRLNSRQRGYTWAWQKARAAWLREHPICVRCENECIVRPADTVDHIIPHRGDMLLFWDSEHNWQSLCGWHNNRKRMLEDNKIGRTEGMRVVVCGRPGSGKTRYVNEHRREGDLVWDMDAMASTLTGMPLHSRPDELVDLFVVLRLSLCQWLASHALNGRAWVIVSDKAKAESVARQIRAQVFTLDVSADECLRRLRSDGRCTERAEQAAREWGETNANVGI